MRYITPLIIILILISITGCSPQSHCESMLKSKRIIAPELACQKLTEYEITGCQTAYDITKCKDREMAERYCLYGKAFKKGWSSPKGLEQMFPQEMAKRIILSAEGHTCVGDILNDDDEPDVVGEVLRIIKQSDCKFMLNNKRIIASESACQKLTEYEVIDCQRMSKSIESACQKLTAYEIIDCQRMSNRCRDRERAERYCLYGKAFKNGWSSPRQLDQMFPQENARGIILTAEGSTCVGDVSDDVVGKLLDRTLQGK